MGEEKKCPIFSRTESLTLRKNQLLGIHHNIIVQPRKERLNSDKNVIP